jgi:hypothetical protein
MHPGAFQQARPVRRDAQGREGLLSAVVVHADDGRPGKGFDALGRDLGFKFDDDVTFWQEQVEKVHQPVSQSE